MSEETLRRFVDRLNVDAAFRETVQKDASSAFTEFGLSPAEQVALACNDEDALRRLAGNDVQGYLAPTSPQAPGGVVPANVDRTFLGLCTSIFCGGHTETRDWHCPTHDGSCPHQYQ